MRDLTIGSVESHLLRLAGPIAAGMFFQTLYFIVDLYFVAHLGDVAIAGVAAAGNAVFLVMALTQMIGAGTLSLLARAVGRKDREDANLVFNQSLVLSGLCLAASLLFGWSLTQTYMRIVAADAAIAHAGFVYLSWYLPGLSLQFLIVSMGSALRATGIVKPVMLVQALTVILNIVLAPVLIAGWFTHVPLGVMGAGLASSLALAIGAVLLVIYFVRYEAYVRVDTGQWRPDFAVWRRLVAIGFPAGAEMGFIFLYTAFVYALIRHFGTNAQAGFGVGSRVMQAIFLPGLALAFAAAPVAGQNFGAGHSARVRATLRAAVLFCSVVMALLTLLCQVQPQLLLQGFTNDGSVVAQGAVYLRIVSWNFVATGIVLSCSALFQALGNTWPALISTASRLVTFALPATLISTLPRYRIEDLWYLSVATVALQAATSFWLVHREFRRRLSPATELSTHYTGIAAAENEVSL